MIHPNNLCPKWCIEIIDVQVMIDIVGLTDTVGLTFEGSLNPQMACLIEQMIEAFKMGRASPKRIEPNTDKIAGAQ